MTLHCVFVIIVLQLSGDVTHARGIKQAWSTDFFKKKLDIVVMKS